MPKPPTAKCAVIAQATLAGLQEHRARGFGREAGWTPPYIAVRVGSVLLNIEDRDALACLTEAVRAANYLANTVFVEIRRPAR